MFHICDNRPHNYNLKGVRRALTGWGWDKRKEVKAVKRWQTEANGDHNPPKNSISQFMSHANPTYATLCTLMVLRLIILARSGATETDRAPVTVSHTGKEQDLRGKYVFKTKE